MVKDYQSGNVDFAYNVFVSAGDSKLQTISFCGVGANNQNGIVDNNNKLLTLGVKMLSLHVIFTWTKNIDTMFCPFTIKAMSERLNCLHIDIEGNTAESLLHDIPKKTF